MSERSGIPVSTLSKVEHDRLTLTYDKLLQLSQKLNIRMSELFAESEPRGRRRHRAAQHRPAWTIRSGSRRPITTIIICAPSSGGSG